LETQPHSDATQREGGTIYHLRNVVLDRKSEGVSFRLNVPSLQIRQGEQIAVIGESGCGKSTLLDILAFIAKPSDIDSFRFRPNLADSPTDIGALWDKKTTQCSWRYA